MQFVFLFCLDLILKACKIPFRYDTFEILDFAIKQGLTYLLTATFHTEIQINNLEYSWLK